MDKVAAKWNAVSGIITIKIKIRKDGKI